ncbi:hypothetical protein NUH86_18520 [Sphingobium sp. JS3065]|uniref:hypothetical protein n=1 Tax=Sphingobium sp. JS3065 TaxID=2970925 RepID=UPI002263F40C|nr:hypothetical protein [Sphingobium sp. JS3065]UZW57575.1 hypothetical protein NUH86_18520 [Sphingobium sp. JS3065]
MMTMRSASFAHHGAGFLQGLGFSNDARPEPEGNGLGDVGVADHLVGDGVVDVGGHCQ